ncbi:hypothetical protein HK096_000405 [Nowakowskiella sp. JEL0078]|nr:hypothetical protein HK096_000405 [Nowakowskiella sp. JEL0078]
MEIPQSNSQAIIKRDKVAPLRYDQPRKPKNIVETNINYILDIHGKSTHVSPTQITATKLTPDQQNIIIKSTKPPSNFATATKHLSERFSDPESARLTNRNSDLDFGRSSGRLYMPNNGGTPNRGQGDKTKSRNSKSNFQDYMDPADVSKGLRSGILLMGSLRINKHNRSDAYVSLDPVPDIAPLSHATGNSIDLSQDIYVFGEKARNRALEGEIVIIQLLQGEELKFNQAIVNNKRLEKKEEERGRQEKIRVSKELVEDDNNIVDVDDTDTDDMTRLEFGKVVSIAERKLDRKFVGVLSVEKHSKDSKKPEEGSEPKTTTLFWFKPNDKRVPWMTIIPKYIPEDFIKDPQSYSDKLWLASLESWPSYSNYPRAKIVSVLGQVGNIDIETEALLAENGVTWTDTFSPKVEACLPTLPWVIPESEFKKRKDLREKRIFSIDPPTARDLDDAVSCECIDELAHLYSVGVHIADVSYFVKPSSALDIEAAERATTVYLVQKAVPMLPRILSENLCSLNPNVDRLAFSVIFTINSITGEIVGDPWFGKTVIRSSAKLSYDHAQAVIDGTAVKSFEDTNELPNVGFGNGTKFENIKEDILKLYGISKVLRKLRFESGALAIHSVKLAFELVDGHPVASGIYLIKESNRLIEEFMLLANMAVAKKIAKSFPSVALLRSHSPPIARRLVDLLALAEGLGHKLNASSSGSLQASFEAINDLPTRSVLELLAVKSMKRARYVCAGSVHTLTGYHHYALNIPLYTHFTSPIRRYCDLIVHRMLEVSLETPLLKSQIEFGVQYNLKNIVHIANLCNSNKDAAKAVQDASSKLFLCIYIANVQERLIMQSENQTSEQNQLRIRTAQSGVLLNAIVYNISQRSFDVLISDLGLERRVWLEDLVDRNEIWGSEWDEGMLTVIWKRNTNWDFDLPRNMGEFPNKVIVNVDKTQASLIKFKNEQDEGLSTVGTVANNGRKLIQRLKMDTSQYREQKIRIFQRVAIRVQSNVQKSPAELKILAEYPGFMKLAQEDSDFTKDFKKWNEIRIIERGNACEQVCLGIVDDD